MIIDLVFTDEQKEILGKAKDLLESLNKCEYEDASFLGEDTRQLFYYLELQHAVNVLDTIRENDTLIVEIRD